MKKWERLPDAELDVMMTLWHAPTPITVGEIVRELAGTHSWKAATVHVLLDRLEERGFVTVDRSGYAYRFSPAVREAEYSRREAHSFIQRFFSGSAKKMIVSMIDADGLDSEDIAELTALLNEQKEKRRKP